MVWMGEVTQVPHGHVGRKLLLMQPARRYLPRINFGEDDDDHDVVLCAPVGMP